MVSNFFFCRFKVLMLNNKIRHISQTDESGDINNDQINRSRDIAELEVLDLQRDLEKYGGRIHQRVPGSP